MRPETAQSSGCSPAPTSTAAPPATARATSLTALPGLLACEQCDALYHEVRLSPGQQARCLRCASLVGRGHRIGLQGIAALTVAAAVTFLIALSQPIVHLSFSGVGLATSLPRALVDTWNAGEPWIALLAGAVTVLFPGLVLALRLYVLIPLLGRDLPPAWRLALRGVQWASRWSMVEVLMLSAMVALVRLSSMATVVVDAGLFAFGALAVLLAALESAGVHRLWRLAQTVRPGDPDV